jgi:hypothetical protein
VPKAPLRYASQPAQNQNVIVLPLVLLLGCSAAFEARCREIGTRAKLLVRGCEVPFSRPLATRIRPLVILVPTHIYELAPRGFDLLAEDAGAMLVRVDDEQGPSVALEYRLLDAVLAATNRRRA